MNTNLRKWRWVVRKHGDILLDRIDQSGQHPREEHRDTEPGNIFRYRRIRGGRMKFTGELEPETAEFLEALLDKWGKPESPAQGVPDPRPIEERHGDARSEVVHRAANPKGHARVQLTVHLDLNQLLHGLGGATLDSGCPLAPPRCGGWPATPTSSPWCSTKNPSPSTSDAATA